MCCDLTCHAGCTPYLHVRQSPFCVMLETRSLPHPDSVKLLVFILVDYHPAYCKVFQYTLNFTILLIERMAVGLHIAFLVPTHGHPAPYFGHLPSLSLFHNSVHRVGLPEFQIAFQRKIILHAVVCAFRLLYSNSLLLCS